VTETATTAENAYRAMQAEYEGWALRKFADKLSSRIPDGDPTEVHEDAIGIILELRADAAEKKAEAAAYRQRNVGARGNSSTPAYDALLTLYGSNPTPELIAAIGHRDAEVLRTAADKLDALPPGGEALKGPVWYREGIHDAADLCRDWAGRADNMDGFTGPITYDLLTELRHLRNFQQKAIDELARARSEARNPAEILLADVMAKRLGVTPEDSARQQEAN
jgi:hypothetical protein